MLSYTSFGQGRISYKIRNIINTNIPVNYSDFNDNSYKMCAKDSIVYVYNISYVDNNCLELLKINSYSSILDTLKFFYPNLSNKIQTPFLNFIQTDNNYFVLYSSYNNLFIYKKDSLIFDTIIDKCTFDDCKILGDRIFFYSTYNYNKLSCLYNTRLALFDIKNKKFLRDTFLNNPYVEFTHYSPNNLININNKGNILYSNSVENKIFLFDSLIRLIKQFNLGDSNWKEFPLAILKNYYKIKGDRSPKKVIEFLDKFENKYNRIERVVWITDSTFLVIKIPTEHLKLNHKREYCFYQINGSDNIPLIYGKFEEIEDIKDKELKLTYDNFPMLSSSGFNCLFNDNCFYRLFPYCNSKNIINMSLNEIDKVLETSDEKDIKYSVLFYQLK